jgi:hypothetical protein
VTRCRAVQVQAARIGDKQKLDDFQEKVKQRATRIQREMRMVKLEWKREVRLPVLGTLCFCAMALLLCGLRRFTARLLFCCCPALRSLRWR